MSKMYRALTSQNGGLALELLATLVLSMRQARSGKHKVVLVRLNVYNQPRSSKVRLHCSRV